MGAYLAVLATAGAFTTEAIEARIAEVAPLRAHSLGEHDPAIPASAYETVASGRIATGLTAVEGHKARIAWGVGVVEAPIAALFSAVNDGRNKVEYSKLSDVQLLEGEYCGARRVAFQYLPVPMISDRWWVVEQRINTAVSEASAGGVRELVWVRATEEADTLSEALQKRVDGAVHAAANDGGWWLVALDDEHTLMEFWALSDPGGSVPAGLAGQFASGSIRDTFAKMGELARKGPSCQL